MHRLSSALVALLATAATSLAQAVTSPIANSLFPTATSTLTSIPTSLATAGVGTNSATSTVQGGTGVAFFTIDAISYGATAVSGEVIIAGYTLTPGGAAANVGGEDVSAVSSGIVFGGQTALFSTVTPSTSAAAADSSSGSAPTSSSSVAAAASSSSPAGTTSSSALAAQVTNLPGAFVAIGGIAGIMAML